MQQMTNENCDLVIVGGGPAGMSAALVAGRALLNTLVVNAESPRNMVTTASHGFLTRDGVHPLELMEIAKQQLEKYDTVTYMKGFVTDVEKLEKGFQVTTGDGKTFTTDNIIFATGYKEDVGKSNLPGIEKVYGKSVYPCPFCDGWEHRGQKLALFDDTEIALEFAKIIANWSNDLIIFTNGKQAISAENKRLLQNGGISVVEEPIAELMADDQGGLQFVLLENGAKVAREAGFLMNTYQEPSTYLPEKLGVLKTASVWGMEMLDADESGKTSIEGLYIVGDAKTGFSGIVAAANDGASCVEAIVHDRVAAYWLSL
ncbi:NAD(P)/FAD-dependent oxidoreductase [Chloroflexi bacterium TSY]|nr:NAD(P)/FAD-dependent oxidoreductase [Chloroflexi bacterium TSY]